MRKLVQIALAVLLVVVGSVIAWQVLRLREPVYQGKTLNAWLQEYVAADNQFPVTEEKAASLRRAGDGIRRIGTNALPFLVQMARAKDSPFKRFITAAARNQSLIRVHLRTDKEIRDLAVVGFYALGPIGKDAVPVLVELLNGQDRDVRLIGADCLGNIGPDAKVAVPALLSFLNNTSRDVRFATTVNLGRIHMDAALVVPILITNLTKSNAILPITINVLGKFEQEAKPATFALLQFLNHENEYVRVEATNALKKIDPEAAAKAGVR
jgi:HEAT repeat protein